MIITKATRAEKKSEQVRVRSGSLVLVRYGVMRTVLLGLGARGSSCLGAMWLLTCAAGHTNLARTTQILETWNRGRMD